jgi:hypothetical protein
MFIAETWHFVRSSFNMQYLHAKSRVYNNELSTCPEYSQRSSYYISQFAPKALSAMRSSLTAVAASSKFKAEMAHFACF